jgi:uncharacterized protein
MGLLRRAAIGRESGECPSSRLWPGGMGACRPEASRGATSGGVARSDSAGPGSHLRASRSDLLRIGYFGSLRRGDWGVGSDVDLVVVLIASATPPIERPLQFDLSAIPVGADLIVYTPNEWDALVARKDRFAEEMRNVAWL